MVNFISILMKKATMVVKNFFKPRYIDLSLISPVKQNLKYLHPGMFWYVDNLFSNQYFPSRPLRAIVLDVSGGSVIGVVPLTSDIVYHKGVSYDVGMYLENNLRNTCLMKRPRLKEFKKMRYNLEILNKSMRDCYWPELQGKYWAWNWNRKTPDVVFDMETGKTQNKAEGMSAIGLYVVHYSFKLTL